MTETTDSGPVADRLWSRLLESFARDVTVEGHWLLTHEDSLLPDFAVSIGRMEDARPVGPSRERSDAFAESLHDLLDAAYGEGCDVEGRWFITYASPEIPDWEVVVELDPFDEEKPEPAGSDGAAD